METDANFETSVAHVAAGKGSKSVRIFGELVMFKIASYQTGGAYSLFEVVTQPGSGPPPHIHHREDEALYVLDGQYEFLDEGRAITVGVGSLIYVPKGILHAHKNVGEGPGRMLMSQTPGGLYERFAEEIGEASQDAPPLSASQDSPGMAKFAEIAAEYGIEIPSPGRAFSQKEIKE